MPVHSRGPCMGLQGMSGAEPGRNLTKRSHTHCAGGIHVRLVMLASLPLSF